MTPLFIPSFSRRIKDRVFGLQVLRRHSFGHSRTRRSQEQFIIITCVVARRPMCRRANSAGPGQLLQRCDARKVCRSAWPSWARQEFGLKRLLNEERRRMYHRERAAQDVYETHMSILLFTIMRNRTWLDQRASACGFRFETILRQRSNFCLSRNFVLGRDDSVETWWSQRTFTVNEICIRCCP